MQEELIADASPPLDPHHEPAKSPLTCCDILRRHRTACCVFGFSFLTLLVGVGVFIAGVQKAVSCNDIASEDPELACRQLTNNLIIAGIVLMASGGGLGFFTIVYGLDRWARHTIDKRTTIALQMPEEDTIPTPTDMIRRAPVAWTAGLISAVAVVISIILMVVAANRWNSCSSDLPPRPFIMEQDNCLDNAATLLWSGACVCMVSVLVYLILLVNWLINAAVARRLKKLRPDRPPAHTFASVTMHAIRRSCCLQKPLHQPLQADHGHSSV